ncbi:MAG: DUF5928 domain-containing protein [Pseudomonadota bacterium]
MLCHKDPDRVEGLVRLLTGQGDSVVIHADRNAGPKLGQVVQKLARSDRVSTVPRLRCGWGTWSLVAASLSLLREGLRAYPNATHFYLISGDCFPIKSAATIREALAPADRDHIELNDFFSSGWIRTGLKEERLIYRHPFNERSQKGLFYLAFEVQKRLGLRRALPKGIRVEIGSQWWCLRRRTAKAVLDLMAARPDLMRFFRTTWIPDETFFQTLVGHVVPRGEITGSAPTFHLFSDYGLPVNFHNDHLSLLKDEASFFARKLSPNAHGLRARLRHLYEGPATAMPGWGGGARYFEYVTGRGRKGTRFGPRIEASGGAIGRALRVHVVLCKKWHVGKRMVASLAETTGTPGYGYVFQDTEAGLPPMGGLEVDLARRGRNRAAFLSVLARITGGPLTLCLDPQEVETLRMFNDQGVDLRVLEIACDFTSGYLEGHAQRMGLPTASLDEAGRAGLMRTLRENIAEEHRALAEIGLTAHRRVDEYGSAQVLADALSVLFELAPEPAYRAAHNARFNQPGSAHVRL